MHEKSGFTEVTKRPEINPERKAAGKEEYEKRINRMVLEAILKHIQAVSYRAFRVGCSVLADNPRVKGNYEVRSDHNFKPWENAEYGWDKLCAENNATAMAIVHGAEYIPAIVVASHHKEIGEKPEDDTHSQKALHSCRNCRNLFRELIEQGIMSDETIIRFVDDGELIYEDLNDMEEFIIETGGKPLKIQWPKLKLKKEISEADAANLPFEEMTMKEFLNMPKYKNDGEPKKGKTPPPYQVVLPK